MRFPFWRARKIDAPIDHENLRLSERLESMRCNAPRAHCGRNVECECAVLGKAAAALRKKVES